MKFWHSQKFSACGLQSPLTGKQLAIKNCNLWLKSGRRSDGHAPASRDDARSRKFLQEEDGGEEEYRQRYDVFFVVEEEGRDGGYHRQTFLLL